MINININENHITIEKLKNQLDKIKLSGKECQNIKPENKINNLLIDNEK